MEIIVMPSWATWPVLFIAMAGAFACIVAGGVVGVCMFDAWRSSRAFRSHGGPRDLQPHGGRW